MLITAQILRNVSIVTDSRKTRGYLRSPTANCRPIILSGSQAGPLIIPYKVIFVMPLPEGNRGGKRHLESRMGPRNLL